MVGEKSDFREGMWELFLREEASESFSEDLDGAFGWGWIIAGARCVHRRDVFSLLAVESAETYAKRQLLEGKGDVL